MPHPKLKAMRSQFRSGVFAQGLSHFMSLSAVIWLKCSLMRAMSFALCSALRRNPAPPVAILRLTRIAQVFQLYQIEELPNREACEQLNISESNLWVMLHRARKQLCEHLDGW
jgi:sigma-70-like protein